jgi:hypothetical protein
MECKFHVGQKVVCIDDDKTPPAGHVVLSDMIFPVIGKIYTVSEIRIGTVGNMPCIALAEIPFQLVEVLVDNEIRVGDVVFNASAFRPLVDRKTDISIFKAMLAPQTEQVPA